MLLHRHCSTSIASGERERKERVDGEATKRDKEEEEKKKKRKGMKKEKGRGKWNKKEIYYLFLDIAVHKFYFPFIIT
jgi:hypothetical protein